MVPNSLLHFLALSLVLITVPQLGGDKDSLLYTWEVGDHQSIGYEHCYLMGLYLVSGNKVAYHCLSSKLKQPTVCRLDACEEMPTAEDFNPKNLT